MVQSAYLTFPFFDYLAEAAGRGVAVTLVTPKDNNKPRFSAYTEWAAARAGAAVRLYDGRMSHIKAMLVDDEALVVGSSNFDYLSFHTQQEVLAIVRSPEVIAQVQARRAGFRTSRTASGRRGILRLPPDVLGTVAPRSGPRGGAGEPMAAEAASGPRARSRGHAGSDRGGPHGTAIARPASAFSAVRR